MNEGPVLVELDGERMRALLSELDERLAARGIKASVYVVGGAAMTLAYGREEMTPDIDALISHRAVLEEARHLAVEHGLPATWLNSNAAGWVPPRPAWALRRPTELGLTAHVAPPEHLLAMKLVAARRKDRPDIRRLVRLCDLTAATSEDFADLLQEVYSGEGRLAQMLGTSDDHDDVRREALAIGEWAATFAALDAGR